jgi:hypothetical protein
VASRCGISRSALYALAAMQRASLSPDSGS